MNTQTPPPPVSTAPVKSSILSYEDFMNKADTVQKNIYGVNPFMVAPIAASGLIGAGVGAIGDDGVVDGAIRGVGAGVGGAAGGRLGYKYGPTVGKLISPFISKHFGVDLSNSPWWGLGGGVAGSLVGSGMGYKLTKKLVGKSPEELNNRRIGNTGTLVIRGR